MSEPTDLVVVPEAAIRDLLVSQRSAVVDLVAEAYRAFGAGQANVPHSLFLRFPDPRNRIIALPAFYDGEEPVAGVKWVASFPPNHERGLRRATATMVLNSAETGFPRAFLEATHISAHRTAASAALAAKVCDARVAQVGVVGCGPIAQECLSYLAVTRDLSGSRLVFHDLVAERAEALAAWASETLGAAATTVNPQLTSVVAESDTLLLCTTAAAPYIDGATFPAGATVLHVSLRDLSADVILGHRNLVDDLDHVNRAATSIELASTKAGHTDFVAGALHDVLAGRIEARTQADEVVIFSPFGLGILDLVVAQWVEAQARSAGTGHRVPGFVELT